MNEIDWSNAPPDAEAGYCGTSQAYDAWYRRDGAGQVQQMCPAAGYPDWTWMGGRKDFPVGAELRPAAESAWDGEGLPPVGTVCEWAGCTLAPEDPDEPDLHIGDKVTIIAHFKDGEFDLAAFTFNPQIHNHDRGTAWVNQGGTGCFRPIRTVEQIAAEERTKAIDDLVKVTCINRGEAALIYDAGYRKQVQP